MAWLQLPATVRLPPALTAIVPLLVNPTPVAGELPTLVVTHLDRHGVIASVTAVLAEGGVNIASMRDSRERRGERALMLIETDGAVPGDVLERVGAVHDVSDVRAVPAV